MIKFGPSGNSTAFYEAGKTTTEESALWVKDMGLDCFEYSFGMGIRLSEEKAVSIGKAFFDAGIEISVHAPYYINLSNPEEENVEKSYKYIIDSAKICKLMGGKRVVFHPASQGKAERKTAVDLAEKRFNILCDKIYREGLNDILFCPETMGKLAQIGTIEEIVRFCKIDKTLVPTVDFGHVNAREQGSLKTEKDYEDRLNYMIAELGQEKMKDFHVHFSKIEYTSKGEVRHLTFEDEKYGPEFEPLASVLKKLKLEPYIVSESAGTQDKDALYMKKTYNAL